MSKTSQKAAENLGADAMQQWVEMVSEGVQFVVSRVQQDLEFQQTLLGCRTLEDLQKVQGDYYRKTMEQYSAESARMMARMVESNVLPKATGGAKRRYDDVPL